VGQAPPTIRPRATRRKTDRTATSGPSPRGTVSRGGASPRGRRNRGRRPARVGWAGRRGYRAEARTREVESYAAPPAAPAGDWRSCAPAAAPAPGARSQGPAGARTSRRSAGCAGWGSRKEGSRSRRLPRHASRGPPLRWRGSRRLLLPTSSAGWTRAVRAAPPCVCAPAGARTAAGRPIRQGAASATRRARRASARTPGSRPDGWDCPGCTCCKSRSRMGQRRAVDRQGY
jgi:hypothetical protein